MWQWLNTYNPLNFLSDDAGAGSGSGGSGSGGEGNHGSGSGNAGTTDDKNKGEPFEFEGRKYKDKDEALAQMAKSNKEAEKKMHTATVEAATYKKQLAEKGKEKEKETTEDKGVEFTGDEVFTKAQLEGMLYSDPLKYAGYMAAVAAKKATEKIDAKIRQNEQSRLNEGLAIAKEEAIKDPEIADNIEEIEKVLVQTAAPLLLKTYPALSKKAKGNAYIAANLFLKLTKGELLSEKEMKERLKKKENATVEGGSGSGGQTGDKGETMGEILASESRKVPLKPLK